MATDNQKLCLWGGFAFLVLYVIGFVPIAHLIPPPAPGLTPLEVAAFFEENRGGILAGMLLCVVASPLIVLWYVVVFLQMLRIETKTPALSYVALINGSLIAPFFMIPPMLWATIAYRSDLDPMVVRSLNDFAWIAWIISWPFVFFQQIAMGLVGLSERTNHPIFPRWLCFASFWAAVSLVPAGAVIFVKSGPFAWNGLISIYIPLCVFVAWYVATTVVLFKAIGRQADQTQALDQPVRAHSVPHPR